MSTKELQKTIETHFAAGPAAVNDPAAMTAFLTLRVALENGAHYAALHVSLFQRVLQSDGVDNRRKHAHAIGANAIHLARLTFDSAENIASAYHQSDFDAKSVNISQLCGNFRHFFGVET